MVPRGPVADSLSIGRKFTKMLTSFSTDHVGNELPVTTVTVKSFVQLSTKFGDDAHQVYVIVNVDAPQVKNVTCHHFTSAIFHPVLADQSPLQVTELSVESHCVHAAASQACCTWSSTRDPSEKGTIYDIVIGSEKIRCCCGIPNANTSCRSSFESSFHRADQEERMLSERLIFWVSVADANSGMIYCVSSIITLPWCEVVTESSFCSHPLTISSHVQGVRTRSFIAFCSPCFV